MKSLVSKDYGFVNIITDLNQVQSGNSFKLFILSKQLLTHKENKDKVIKLFNSKECKISLLIGDEIHHGGSTILSKDLLNKCFKKCSKIFVTATYNKVKYSFDIQETIKWSLEDINIMKQDNDLRLIYSDAGRFIKDNNFQSNDYKLYPKLSVIGVDKFNHVLENGIKSIFDNLAENRDELKQMMNYVMHYLIFKLNEENIKIHQRAILGNKFNKVPVIIIFLPSLNISKTSKILTEVILELNQTVEVCCCNTTDSNNSFKENIVNSQRIAMNLGRSYVISLTGTQGHLGVSIEDCDLVILMNDSNSLDFVFQSMFRCMTESKIGNKQIGYVIDFNLKRSIFSMLEYSNSNNNSLNDIKSLKNIIKNDVIDFRFSTDLEMKLVDRQYMFNQIQEYYNSIKMSRIDYYINKINNIDLELVNIISKDMLIKIKKLRTNIQVDNKKSKDLVFKDNEITLEKGNSNSLTNLSSGNSNGFEIKANDITYFISSIKYLTPLCCILTLNEEGKTKLNLNDMLIYIQQDLNLKEVLLEQFSTWCGNKVLSMDIDNLIQTIEELSLENSSFKQQVEDVSSTIKLILIEAKGDMKEMSKLVEKHLTPSTLEKKKNAEVSTPDKLCKEMLEPLAKEIKEKFKESNGLINKPFKIFEPCCGKGIFLINIYLFLKENSTLSDKQILEECIYFADISPLNIFICRLLLNQIVDKNGKEYKLNYSLGNTLELDINKKWNLEGFDAVVGNPPYNSSGTINSGNTIWQEFVKKSIKKWIKSYGYLLYVHPCGWRKPEEINSKSKTKGLFNLMTKENTIINLKIRNTKHGMEIFKCGTRYDWYLLKKEYNKNISTTVVDEENIKWNLKLYEKHWLANMKFDLIEKIFTNDKDNRVGVLYNRSNYGSDKKHTSYVKTKEFKYPLVHSTPKSGVRYMYSSINDKGHFGVSKVIFGDSGIYDVVIDNDGIFGMTEHAMSIILHNTNISELYKAGLLSKDFKNVLNSCSWSNYQIQWKLFTYLKKDFYLHLEE